MRIDRRGFLTALLAVPAALVGVKLWPPIWQSAGMVGFDLTVGPLVPFNPIKTGTGLHAYFLEKERAQAEIARLSRIPDSVLEACRSGWKTPPIVPELTPDSSKRIFKE